MFMELHEYFDLEALLKQDELNLRDFSARKPSLRVYDYFFMLSRLAELMPKAQKSLDNFFKVIAELEDYRNIDSVINLLNEMGCEKFITNFHSIFDAYGKKGNWREAAAHAKNITEDFKGFHTRIKRAKREPGDNEPIDVAAPLHKCIEILDLADADRKPVILAIDDSPVILKTVSSVLSGDYKVFTLPNPGEISKVLQKLTPDLFLLDYLMPEINGFDLVPIIRGFKEHHNTPIIFLTSEGTLNNITAAIALGASDFIVKPFKPDVLREKIAKQIGNL